MKRILMATDLSARSDRALERALNLVGDQAGGRALTIVHVIDDDLPAALTDAQKTAAKELIERQTATIAQAKGADVEVEVISGRPYREILELSEKIEAEMIILGLHREDALKDMFRGTTAERIIRATNIPVLLVKNAVEAPYQRVMVGVDFSVHSRRAVEVALNFMPGCELHLVHAYNVPFRAFLRGADTQNQVNTQHHQQFEDMINEEMKTFLSPFKDSTTRIECTMQQGEVHEVLYYQVAKIKPDVLAIGTHGRTGIAHAFFGSVAEDLLEIPPCDVLVIKAW
ncbi:MAG: universal stress protein [Pseudomonadota bacterium]